MEFDIKKLKLFDRQIDCWSVLEDTTTTEIVYGGGARGGKTWLGCSWIVTKGLQFPGSAWIIGRNQLKKLKATTLITLFKVFKEFKLKEGRDYKYNAQDSVITFFNGTKIFLIDLCYMPSDPEFDRLGSYDLTGAFVDEAQEVSGKVRGILKGRFSLLRGEGWKTTPKALYTCNPKRNWIYTDFYKPFTLGKLPEKRCFIRSLAKDNPFVPNEYIENLKTADKITVERLLYGNFEYDEDPLKIFEYDAIIDLFTNRGSKGEKSISCDVGRKKDYTVIGNWVGLHVNKIKKFLGSIPKTIKAIKVMAKKEQVRRSKIVIDEGGVGGGVVDGLEGCYGFWGAAKPIVKKRKETTHYLNLRAQCFFKLAEFVNKGKIGITCSEEMRVIIIDELDAIRQVNADKDGKAQIESKKDIIERLGHSPDFADMLSENMVFHVKQRSVVMGSF